MTSGVDMGGYDLKAQKDKFFRESEKSQSLTLRLLCVRWYQHS